MDSLFCSILKSQNNFMEIGQSQYYYSVLGDIAKVQKA